MKSRIASVLLVLLTIGFFVFHFWWKKNHQPPFAEIINPIADTAGMIVHNEYLILMDEENEKRIDEVLKQFDLIVITPLGEWVHVARKGSENTRKMIPFDSIEAKDDLAFAKRIEQHEAVHSALVNFVQNSDAALGCVDEQNDKNVTEDAAVYPSDPFFKYQWHLSKETGINLPGAWAVTTGSDKTVIALVDRNFDFSENDFNMERCTNRKYYYENVLEYFPEKPVYQKAANESHGSQVLSVIAPCTNNNEGLSGIDWYAQVFAVDSKENATYSARMFGILWASGLDVCTGSIIHCPENSSFQKNIHAANVINTSFGFAGDFLKDPPYGPVLDVIGRINRQGRIIVASAGNEGQIADRRLPGAAGGVISVGSSNRLRKRSYFSNIGRTIDVYAPGEDIVGISRGRPIELNGTSFSAPIVAGVVSLMLAANPLMSWKHVEYILKKTATPMPCEDYCPKNNGGINEKACLEYCCVDGKIVCGSGIVNAKAAVLMAKAGFPNVALVDVDDYFVALSEDKNLSTKIVIKNWGKKKGIMRMRKTDKNLKMSPETVVIDPINNEGVPGTAYATVFYTTIPKNETVVSLLIEAASEDKPNEFHDRIEAIVSIVPDPVRKRKKLLREVLPKK